MLTASGLIAGEALMGLVKAGFGFAKRPSAGDLREAAADCRAVVLVILATADDPGAAGECGPSGRSGAADGDHVAAG